MNEAIRGEVIESLPNLLYKVKLTDDKEILAYVSGRMKIHKIKLLIGDKVDVVLDPYKGTATNRIVKRV